MRHVPILPLWKRAIVLAQLVTFPIWIFPLCFWHGLRRALPEVPGFFKDGWRVITAQGIEAAEADETRSGSAVGESPVPNGDVPK